MALRRRIASLHLFVLHVYVLVLVLRHVLTHWLVAHLLLLHVLHGGRTANRPASIHVVHLLLRHVLNVLLRNPGLQFVMHLLLGHRGGSDVLDVLLRRPSNVLHLR